jgi:hypothetical protein
MADINGIFERRVVMDRRGSTDNVVSGFGNTVSFHGDNGRNRFDVVGGMHNVDVNNLGRDDRVNLHGPGWNELPDANSRDGVVRYYNSLNGSYAEVRTDDGRNDNFVRARVNGANPTFGGGDWAALGQMNYASAAYLAGMQQGYRAGYQDGFADGGFAGFQSGRIQGRMDFGNALGFLALGPLAWFLG